MSPDQADPGIVFSRDPAATDPPYASIPELVHRAASRFGDAEFLRFPGVSLGFAEVDTYTDKLAHVLALHGVAPGDRVAIMLDNVPGWPLSWFAILKAGAVAVPVNARLRESDLLFVLRDSGALVVLTSDEHAGLVRATAARLDPAPEVRVLDELKGDIEHARPDRPFVLPAARDIANLQYTSGTTGFPKACMLTHDYWLRTAWLVAMEAELRTDDVMIMSQAFSYMDTQWAAVMCLMAGNPFVVLPRFSASEFWPSVREHAATLTYVLGTMPLLMFKQPPHPLTARTGCGWCCARASP